MAAGGAGRGASINNYDKYGDIWPEFRFGIDICDDVFKTHHMRKIQLDSTREGTWNRYFIYKNFNIQERGGQCIYKISGLLIDNYGQPYPIDFKYVNENPMSYSTSPTITPLIIQPDDIHYKKLTRAQIDYVKVTGKGLSIDNIENIKRVFCADELHAIRKANEHTHAEYVEELARLRIQLELSARRELEMREQLQGHREEIERSRRAAADSAHALVELQRRCNSNTRSRNNTNNNPTALRGGNNTRRANTRRTNTRRTNK